MDTYEKKYKEALERAIVAHKDEDRHLKATLERIFPELAESEDEKIIKRLITDFGTIGKKEWGGLEVKDILAWLEKQGEHANFRNKIQVGDKVTRNEAGVLVNLSQLNRVAKKNERQGEQKASYTTIVETGNGGINSLVTRELPTDSEQKPANKVEPKFKVGEKELTDEELREGLIRGMINEHNRVVKEVLRTEYEKGRADAIAEMQKDWSLVDKDILFRIICDLKFLRDTISIDPNYAVNIIDMEREITWLKSLRPQNRWKPNELQLGCLSDAIEHYNSLGCPASTLKELLDDLKKLKEGEV